MEDEMKQPVISRPEFPEGYLPKEPEAFLTWAHVEQKLGGALHYWLCSVRPDGRPHVVPRWGVWVDGKLYYDGSPETRHARNIAENDQVNLHLESGEEVVIMEGVAGAILKPPTSLAAKVALAYAAKYAARGYAPQPDQWDDGGLYAFTPHKVLAWTEFNRDPTRFVLEP
jgi:hypothetical protein